jgi:hypothetical protein
MRTWIRTQRRCHICRGPLIARWMKEGFRKNAAVYVCQTCDLTPTPALGPEFHGPDPRVVD